MKAAQKFLSLMLTLCLLTSVIVTFPVSAEENTDKTDDQIVDVTTFGADSTGATDSALAIQAAIAHAKTLAVDGKHVTISFPKGRYDIYPDKAVKRELYISNTVGTEQAYKDKNIGILLEGIDNVTVDGNGSLFMFHGKMMTFAAIDCENVTFKNYEVDFQVPTVIDVTVEKVDSANKTATIYIPECYNYSISNNTVTFISDNSPYTNKPYWTAVANTINYTQRYDIRTGRTWRGSTGTSAFSNIASIEELGNHRIKITYTTLTSDLAEGMCYQMRPTKRDHSGTFFWKSKDVTLQNLDIHFLHGFGMVGQSSENITINDVDFETTPGKGTTTASYADFIQMSGCKGKIEIENCTFANPHDDPINIHGTYMQVISKNDSANQITVRFNHGETAGFPNFFKDDEIEFYDSTTLLPVANSTRKVVEVDGPDGMGGRLSTKKDSLEGLTDITLTLDSPAPSQVVGSTNSNYYVENITYTPEVHIHNNILKETPTRGILVTTKKPIVIENNTFDGMGMAGIYISDDAGNWRESGHTEDVIIRNNVFTRGQNEAIFIDPQNYPSNNTNTVHKKILIENNTFFLENLENYNPLIKAISVGDLTLKNNNIYRQNPGVSITVNLTQNSIAAGDTTTVTNNVNGGTTLTKPAFNFIYSTVNIEDNIYDGGINATVQNSGSNVTVKTGDKANTTTPTNGTVYYESSDPTVATVDGSGKITGIRSGTANITAYLILGNRRFDSEPKTITVTSGSSTTQGPTAISIIGETEVLDVNKKDSATYTAKVTTPDGTSEEDKTVTWTVLDAETQETYQNVSIENGTLTIEEGCHGGIAEVVAKTPNNIEARKLVILQESGIALDDGVSVVGDTQNGAWTIVEDNKIQVKAVHGGLWTEAAPANLILKEFDFSGHEGETVSATIKLDGKTAKNYDEAGLVFFNTEDSFVQVQRKHNDGNATINLVSEHARANGNQSESNKVNDVTDTTIYLKLEKNGDEFTGYYKKENESSWTQLGSGKETNTTIGDKFKIGISVGCGQQNNQIGENPTLFTFTEFTVNDNSENLTKQLTPATLNGKPEINSANLSVDVSKLTSSDESADKRVYWAISDKSDGDYSVIAGTSSAHLNRADYMKDKYVKAAVIPINGHTAGSIYWSDALQITGNEETSSGAYSKAFAYLKTAKFSNDLFKNFVSGTDYYYTAADNDVKDISYEFAPSAEDSTVKVYYDGKELDNTKGNLTLHNAHNVIEVKVTANGNVTSKTYRFVISRTGSSAKALTFLSVDGEAIELKDGVYSYSYPVKEGTKSATITANAADTATVVIAKEGKKAEDGKVALIPGSNIVMIVVTPETQETPARYTLNIKVPDKTNSSLEKVIFSDNVQINETFDKAINEYTGTVKSGDVHITAAAEELDATVTVTVNDSAMPSATGAYAGNIVLNEGENKLVIKVVSPDSSKTAEYNYTIVGKSYIYLSDLEWNSNSTIGWSAVTITKDAEVESGGTLTLIDNDGTAIPFEKGVATHADSNIYYDLTNKGYIRFESYIGVDASQGNKGSVIFKVIVDGKTLYTSETLTGSSAMKFVSVDIPENAKLLTLVADKVENNGNDHADWADAKFITPFVEGSFKPSVDKSGLQKRLTEAQAIKSDDYTEDSYSKLQSAITEAENVNNNSESTQAEVNKALEELNTAMNGLVKKGEPPITDNIGDVNEDGAIDTLDVTIVLQRIAQIIDEDAKEYNAVNADVNFDGDVDTSDVTLILQYIASIITKFN